MATATQRPVSLKVGDFQIEALGVEWPDYFQGYGLGPRSTFQYCAYGIGDTEEEALADCLEMVAQQGFDVDGETEERIRAEYGLADDSETALEALGVEEETDDSPYFHVGMKWNCQQEERLRRIRRIPNLEFLQYADYRPLETDSHGYGRAWGYVHRAEGDVSYGDLKATDCPESAVNYLESLHVEDTEPGEVYFYVPCASGSDYSGSTVERSNYNVFIETYGEYEFVFSAHGGFNTYAAVVGLTGLLECADDTFDAICSALEGLDKYPLLDDEALSNLEMEGANEAWESWVAGDFRRALEKKFDGVDFEWPPDSDLRPFFEKSAEKANEYWFNEGYGPDMYIRVDKVVGGIEFADVEKWAVKYTVSWVDVGAQSEAYYLESEAIQRVESLRAAGHFEASYTA